ncbi:hypothetical protein AMS68_006804 [Peltaster fructicola]|uniref:Uncharacterized protein n=1 Tax=Peltaster fructicola TaxID=286661 RepID=A0A6H0Y2Q8_9PEZI|nr:hypothetical protein AMS68_006804 [Peltaster fructicola]
MATTEAGFKPVDTAIAQGAPKDDVESPSLSSSNALARFEFEPGHSKDGTKVLMVEWEDDDVTRAIDEDWEISWDDRRHVLPARGHAQEGTDNPINRLYFLLGAGITVPSAVHLQKGSVAWRTNPLPAIFSPELGATARQAGKKGVLHTIWAKKRLQVLQQEIDSEANNAEGVGLEMAVAEKEWIEQNFGVHPRVNGLSITTSDVPTASLNSPTSPRTPGGGRLLGKLKGLKLGTSEQQLQTPARDEPGIPSGWHNPLSPEGSDVAVGSFGSFAALKGVADPSSMAAKPAQPPTSRKIVAQRPPESFAAQQRQAGGGMGSLNAFTTAPHSFSTSQPAVGDEKDEDDLFALPMSPRSPEMTKSPFSFEAQDTGRYMKSEKA